MYIRTVIRHTPRHTHKEQAGECLDKPKRKRKAKAIKESLSNLLTTEPAVKRARKALNKKEREHLVTVLKFVNVDVLMYAVHIKIDKLNFLCGMKTLSSSGRL